MYWVTRYWQLLLLRLMTGLSLGGILPLVLSLLGDLFSVRVACTIAISTLSLAQISLRADPDLCLCANPDSDAGLDPLPHPILTQP